METTTKSRKYDLHLVYEHGWDNEPKLYIYECYFDGEYWTTNNDPSYHYAYELEDIDWTLKQFELPDISDMWIDEWFSIEDTHLVESNIPPRLRKILDELPEYEPVILDNNN